MSRWLTSMCSTATLVAVVVLLAPAAACAQNTFSFNVQELHAFDEDFYPTCVACADFDDDGWVDLVLSGRNLNNEIAVMRGLDPTLGGGLYADPEFVHVSRQTNYVVARDFDRNGTMDILLSHRTSIGGVLFLAGNGDGTFMPQEEYIIGREPSDLVAGDFDDDGWPDVAVACRLSNELVILRNRGHASFVVHDRVLTAAGLTIPAHPHVMTKGDFDGDGQVDLASANSTSGQVVVALLNSDGTFDRYHRIPLGVFSGLAPADVDDDGDLDFVAPEWLQSGAQFHSIQNDGTGAFTDSSFLYFFGWPWTVATGDFDGDAAEDAVVVGVLSSVLLFMRGDNTGQFEPDFETIIGAFPRMILPRDVDGDCDIDLLVADIATHKLMLWRNTTPQAGGCAGLDLDGNGLIAFGDVLIVLSNFGSAASDADLNCDGVVDFADLIKLLAAFS